MGLSGPLVVSDPERAGMPYHPLATELDVEIGDRLVPPGFAEIGRYREPRYGDELECIRAIGTNRLSQESGHECNPSLVLTLVSRSSTPACS